MRTKIIRLKLIVLVVILLGLGISHTKSLEQKEPQNNPGQALPIAYPFPEGFDYPKQTPEVEQWVKKREEQRIREHGWYLWAGLNKPTPDGMPVWRTWPTSTQAYAVDAGLKQINPPQVNMIAKNQANMLRGEEPINFNVPPYYPVPNFVQKNYQDCVSGDQIKDGATFESNGDIMVAGVIYNSTAFSTIRERKLYLASTLDDLNKPGKPNDPPKHIEQFPRESIVLKPMLWPVKGTGYTPLPVWDDLPASADQGKYIGYEIVGTKRRPKWWRAVAITAQPERRVKQRNVQYLYDVYRRKGGARLGPITYRSAKVVPVESFYHFRFSQEALNKLSACDRAILDASAYWAYKRPFQAGDYLVLIAMHIITKEQHYWTFQSVWWHDQPDKGPYATQRPNIPPEKAPGPWRHYLLTSTYGITQLKNPKKLPITYNPYVELAAGHPIRTNCMNCHHRAAWPHDNSNYEALGPHTPDALDVFTMDNPIFKGLLTVDSMWAMSDRAVTTAPATHHKK